ncbi:hypothetical protein E2C01_076782 [Portunus trituberculatus]|uniref:Uncharacterized protein n=1 Tax=Portunus trituberculatus TaxID=210409 RepID=A0A5B7IJX5_PORTR|nr:hypothetical protein [Portunus trituberculatus]
MKHFADVLARGNLILLTRDFFLAFSDCLLCNLVTLNEELFWRLELLDFLARLVQVSECILTQARMQDWAKYPNSKLSDSNTILWTKIESINYAA